MPKPANSSSSSASANADDEGNEGNNGTEGNNRNNRNGGNGGSNNGRSGDDTRDSLRTEFRELLSTVSTLKPGEREERLLRENFKVRDRLRETQRQLADAKQGAAPQGAVVLTGDDATHYVAVQKLGIPLKDLPTRLAERDTLHAEKTERENTQRNERVARDLDLNPRAFAMFAKANDLVISFKEVKVKDPETGKIVAEEMAMVRRKGEPDDKAKPLSEALESDFTDDEIALLTSTHEPSPRDDRGDTSQTRRSFTSSSSSAADDDSGVRFPAQRTAAPSGASTARKADEKAREAKAGSGRYSM